LSPAIELAVLLPALLLLLGIIVAGARLWFLRSTVAEAAYSGARAASLERSADRAGSAGRQASLEELDEHGARCHSRSIELDLDGFSRPVGRPAAVGVQVSCRVDFGDVAVPGLPGSLMITARASSAIDSYRER
jgi:Flp pilus assembly protein TadG